MYFDYIQAIIIKQMKMVKYTINSDNLYRQEADYNKNHTNEML